MTTRLSNPVYLTILNPQDPNLARVIKVSNRQAKVEILQPFHAAPSGEVAGIQDPVKQATQHILAVLMTKPGERVMRPTYGAGLVHEVFQPLTGVDLSTITARIKDSVSRFEQGIFIQDVTIGHTDAGVREIKVSFRLNTSPVIHTAVYDFAGNRVEL